MPFDYSYVLPPSGSADNAQVREMFEDVKKYVNTLISGGGSSGAPNSATFITISNDATLTNERALTAGTAISLTDNGAGSTLVINNTGVTSNAAGTGISLNQTTGVVTITNTGVTSAVAGTGIGVSGATGAVTISNTGVTSVHGTSSQVSVSGTTGSVTFSLPQDIGTTSSPQFSYVKVDSNATLISPTYGVLFSTSPLTGIAAHGGGSISGANPSLLFVVDGDWVLRLDANGSNSLTTILGDLNLNGSSTVKAKTFILKNNSANTVTIDASVSFTNYNLVLPIDAGAVNQYLTTDGSGNLSWSNAAGTGTVNTGTANHLAYYASTTNAVSSLTAITASRALVSDANGLPVAATTTAIELGYVSGVTSAIQTQLGLKAPLASPSFTGTINAGGLTASLPVQTDASKNLTSAAIDLSTAQVTGNLGVAHLDSGTGASAATVWAGDGSWKAITSVGGATIALDNLAAVAINLALTPGTTNSIAVGSASKEWSNIYSVLGTFSGTVTFAGTTTYSALTASTVPYLDGSKHLTSSSVTPTELGYVSGVTSAIQTQIGLKAPLASPSFTGTINADGLTASLPVQTDASKNLVSAAINLSGSQVTGNLPVTKLNSGTSASATTFWCGDGTWKTLSNGGSATTALDNLSSVAINLSLVPGTDNSIDLGSTSKRWVNIYAKDIDAGASGTAGSVDVFPSTASKGKLSFTAADSAGNTTTTITNASQAAGRIYTIPDAGANANFVMTEGTQTINGSKTLGADLAAGSHKITGLAAGTTSGDALRYEQVIGVYALDSAVVHNTGTESVAGIKTFSTQLIGKGTATNDDAAAGYIGEITSSTIPFASRITLTTNTAADVTSVTLTAGDWDITAAVGYIPGTNTNITAVSSAISATTATIPASTAYAAPNSAGEMRLEQEFGTGQVFTGNFIQNTVFPTYRIKLSGSTTFYLVAKSVFTVAGNQAFGFIQARRRR